MLENRRERILELLRTSRSPIKGEDIGEKFGVSRQVIVQDIAVLRAEGEDIIATPRGYMMMKDRRGIRRKIVTEHGKGRELEEELRIIVDNGGRVIDVIVEHPVYGELTGSLDLEDGRDVDDFLSSLEEAEGEPLSSLTGGIHIHTIEAEDEISLDKIEGELLKKNYLKK